MHKVVTFGELMLRLSPPGFERLFQSPALAASFGGAEANVAVSLAHFGLESQYVTALPPHAIGDAALASLRAEGVQVGFVQRRGTRIGSYYAENGANQRSGQVIYDRARSAVTELEPGSVPWQEILSGTSWFHTTGITPALGENLAECTREALAAAKAAGVRVSLDLNYRQKLWTASEARRVLRPLMTHVDLLIANPAHVQAVFGFDPPATDAPSRELAQRASHELGPALVAMTFRESTSSGTHGWSAALYDRQSDAFEVSRRYEVSLVGRIGGGDSFAAGLIYGLLTERPGRQALDFAVAASALKHTIPGDYNRVSVAEVEQLAQGDGSGRLQR